MTVTADAVTREFPSGNSTFYRFFEFAYANWPFRDMTVTANAVTREFPDGNSTLDNRGRPGLWWVLAHCDGSFSYVETSTPERATTLW